jgi:hypothetical protein
MSFHKILWKNMFAFFFYLIVEITVPVSSTNISTSNECPSQDNL